MKTPGFFKIILQLFPVLNVLNLSAHIQEIAVPYWKNYMIIKQICRETVALR